MQKPDLEPSNQESTNQWGTSCWLSPSLILKYMKTTYLNLHLHVAASISKKVHT